MEKDAKQEETTTEKESKEPNEAKLKTEVLPTTSDDTLTSKQETIKLQSQKRERGDDDGTQTEENEHKKSREESENQQGT